MIVAGPSSQPLVAANSQIVKEHILARRAAVVGALEAQLAELHRAMADPAFYRQEPAAIVQAKTRLQSLEREIAAAYQRWEELESLRE